MRYVKAFVLAAMLVACCAAFVPHAISTVSLTQTSTPILMLNPEYGLPGTTVVISGSGFPWMTNPSGPIYDDCWNWQQALLGGGNNFQFQVFPNHFETAGFHTGHCAIYSDGMLTGNFTVDNVPNGIYAIATMVGGPPSLTVPTAFFTVGSSVATATTTTTILSTITSSSTSTVTDTMSVTITSTSSVPVTINYPVYTQTTLTRTTMSTTTNTTIASVTLTNTYWQTVRSINLTTTTATITNSTLVYNTVTSTISTSTTSTAVILVQSLLTSTVLVAILAIVGIMFVSWYSRMRTGGVA